MASSSKEDIGDGRTFIELQPIDESQKSIVIMDGQVPSLAPVEIEEVDEASINQMNLDRAEFITAEAIKIDKISELSEEDRNLALEQFQFLSGKMTFSDYTIRTDLDTDIVDEEVETRNLFDNTSDSAAVSDVHSESALDINEPVAKENIKKIPSSRPKRTKKTLPAVLKGLMGEANVRLAKGEVELATTICMEIIRQAPHAPDPFKTLAVIYENQPDKALQFELIAAHLSPRDCNQWVRLANLSMEAGNLTQALTCFSKAIQADPKNIELYEIRAKLQEQNLGDKKAYIRAYSRLVHHLGPEDGPNILIYAKALAQRCMQENLLPTALEGMNNIFKKCSKDLITLVEINIMMEILIALKQFERCLDILTEYTSISIEYLKVDLTASQGTENKSLCVTSCNIPDDFAVDLKAKCIISLIELDQVGVVDELVLKFMSLEDPEVSGDLYLDVAEAFMNKKFFEKALNLLEALVKSQNYSLAAVWLRHAECWQGCNNQEKAIKSYEVVRKLSPQHLGARTELSKLYQLKGQFNKAIQVLKQDPESEILDPGILYERTKLLLKVKKYSEYFESGLLLLSRHSVSLRSKSELIALSRTTAFKARVEILHRDRLSRGQPLADENQPTFSANNEPTDKQEFSMLLQMCRVACKLKKYGLFQRLSFTALTSKKFVNENSHIMYLCLIACIRNNDTFNGFNVVRELVRTRKKSKTWNLLNVIIQRAEDSRHNRFMMRQLGKVDVFSYLHILHANNCLVSGTYKYALNDYISLFKVKPNPLLALLVAVTLLQMACQKFSAKKNQLVAQAIAFLKKYRKLRGEQGAQEANYNMARALHQLGLLPGAIHFYKLVLETNPPELIEKNSNLLDLKKEAAFNLHLIYIQAENPELARMYLENYVTV